jgi:hypothetical protein
VSKAYGKHPSESSVMSGLLNERDNRTTLGGICANINLTRECYHYLNIHSLYIPPSVLRANYDNCNMDHAVHRYGTSYIAINSERRDGLEQ